MAFGCIEYSEQTVEHGVYICEWSRSADGWALWLKRRPHIRGEGPNYVEAEDRLLEAIHEAGGAIQAVLEYDPPLPRTALESRYADPELYLICGDAGFDPDAPNEGMFESADARDERLKAIDAHYRAPVCRKCGFTSSPRSDKPLSLAYAPSGGDGAFGFVGNQLGPHVEIVSEEFVDLLRPKEREPLQLRQAVRPRRTRRKFYEVLGPAGPPFVAVKSLKATGWRCTLCGYRLWGYEFEGFLAHPAHISFVARSDLPAPLPGVFTVGVPPEVHLAATAERWKELVGRKGTRGFVSRLLGVAPDHEVDRCPDLPTMDERRRDWRREYHVNKE